MPFVAFPRIVESAQALWEQRRAERDERRRERLQALWLVASERVGSRSALARALGRNRETLSRWLEDYARGGLGAFLQAPLPAGRTSQGGIGLPAALQGAIRARLAAPQGEGGYLALWRWAQAEHGISYSYSHFHRWVRTHLGASLKVARPSHDLAPKKRTSGCATKRKHNRKWQYPKVSMAGVLTRSSSAKSLPWPAGPARTTSRWPATWA